MMKQLSNLGITSNMAYIAALASIVASLMIWFVSRDDDAPHAERFGIFVGLWAPTFAIFGRALEENEHRLLPTV